MCILIFSFDWEMRKGSSNDCRLMHFTGLILTPFSSHHLLQHKDILFCLENTFNTWVAESSRVSRGSIKLMYLDISWPLSDTCACQCFIWCTGLAVTDAGFLQWTQTMTKTKSEYFQCESTVKYFLIKYWVTSENQAKKKKKEDISSYLCGYWE